MVVVWYSSPNDPLPCGSGSRCIRAQARIAWPSAGSTTNLISEARPLASRTCGTPSPGIIATLHARYGRRHPDLLDKCGFNEIFTVPLGLRGAYCHAE